MLGRRAVAEAHLARIADQNLFAQLQTHWDLFEDMSVHSLQLVDAPPGTPDLGWEDNDVTLVTTFAERRTIIDFGSHPYRYAVTRDGGLINEETTLVAETLVECLQHLRDTCCNYCGQDDVIVNDGACAECHAELED